jgi:arginine-tRNA-protein transferase
MRYLYLGLYIAESRAMAYKARYRPHQRLQDGRWVDYE